MKDETLKNFMKEFFPFKELKSAGFFTKEMRGDYEAQADRVCKFFGLKTVYEYGAKEISCHITYSERPHSVNQKGELEPEPFITVITNIYD